MDKRFNLKIHENKDLIDGFFKENFNTRLELIECNEEKGELDIIFEVKCSEDGLRVSHRVIVDETFNDLLIRVSNNILMAFTNYKDRWEIKRKERRN